MKELAKASWRKQRTVSLFFGIPCLIDSSRRRFFFLWIFVGINLHCLLLFFLLLPTILACPLAFSLKATQFNSFILTGGAPCEPLWCFFFVVVSSST